jgi:hypothetical protein
VTGALVAFNSYASSQTITIPTGATRAMVELWGATGGTAGVGGSSYNSTSGGTGAGGFLRKFLTGLTAGNTIVLTVGAGGTAGASYTATSGGNGGSSTLVSGTQSIGALTANGSTGTVVALNSDSKGTAGGTASGGDFNLTGQTGFQGAMYAISQGTTVTTDAPAYYGGFPAHTMYSFGAVGGGPGRGAPPPMNCAGNPGNPGGCLIWWYS